MSNEQDNPVNSLQRNVLQIILLVIAAAGVLGLLYTLRKIMLLLIFTVLFGYLIAPLVNLLAGPRRLGRIVWRMPRALAILAVYVLLFYGLFMALDALAPLFSDQLTALITNAPGYAKQLDQYTQTLARWPARYRLPQSWRLQFNEWLRIATASGWDWAQAVALRTVGLTLYLDWLVLIPVIGFFFLKDGRNFRQNLLAALPKADVRVRVADFLQDVSETLAAYIRAQLMACVLIGTSVGTGLWLLGISYPLVLGVLAGLLEFIPLVGPVTIGVTAALVASFQSWSNAIAVVIFLTILRLLHDYVIYPRLLSRSVELHPVLVILAVLCGAELGGLTGIFLGVPVMALLLVCLRHWRDLQIKRVSLAPSNVVLSELETAGSVEAGRIEV